MITIVKSAARLAVCVFVAAVVVTQLGTGETNLSPPAITPPGPSPTPFVAYTDHTIREDSNAWQGGTFSSTTTTAAYVTDTAGVRYAYTFNQSRIRLSEFCDFASDQTKIDRTNVSDGRIATDFTVSAGYATGTFPDIKCPLTHAIEVKDDWTQDDNNPSLQHADTDIHCHNFGAIGGANPCGDPSLFILPDF